LTAGFLYFGALPEYSTRALTPPLLLLPLKQFNQISRWIFQKNLIPSNAVHNLIPESRILLLQLRDGRFQILDLQLKPVPAAGCGHLSVRHRLARAASARLVQEKPKRPSGQHHKRRTAIEADLKSQHLMIKIPARRYIINNISHVRGGIDRFVHSILFELDAPIKVERRQQPSLHSGT